MLAKKNKIETVLFTEISKSQPFKKVLHTSYFIGTYYERACVCKIACIISKKVFKKAHERNKLRRTFYRACRKELKRNEKEKMSDIFWNAKRNLQKEYKIYLLIKNL